MAIVQNPDEAQFDGMPRSALKYVEADYILPVAEIAPVLVNLAYKPLQAVDSTSNRMEMPPNLAQASMSAVSSSENPRMHSGFRCPECGGVLWELRSGQLLQFQCRVGHLLAAENLLEEQSKELEKLLWNTLSTLEEQTDLAWQLVATYETGEHDLTTRFELKAQESQRRATLIRQMLLNRGEDTTTADLSD